MVKVVTSDDLSKVELWLEEEVLVGLGLDETKEDDEETLAVETPIVDEELLRPRPRTFTMDCIMIVLGLLVDCLLSGYRIIVSSSEKLCISL